MVLMLRVAICAKMMRPAATIQVTNIELVTTNLPIWKIGIGFNDTAGASLSAAMAGAVSAMLKSSVKTDVKKQRLRILFGRQVTRRSLPRDFGLQARPRT